MLTVVQLEPRDALLAKRVVFVDKTIWMQESFESSSVVVVVDQLVPARRKYEVNIAMEV